MSNRKVKPEDIDPGETMQILANEGKELLKQGNRRRIIAREPDGKVLLDISVTQAVIVSLLLLLLPVGWLILLGLVAFGINKKVRLDFVRELMEGDDNVISALKVKHDRLETPDSAADSQYQTQVEEQSVKGKR